MARLTPKDLSLLRRHAANEASRRIVDVLMKICQSHEDMEAVNLLARESVGKEGAQTGNKNASKTTTNIVSSCLEEEKKPRETKQGNSAAYTMRRLAKDFPAIHEKVLADLRLSARCGQRRQRRRAVVQE